MNQFRGRLAASMFSALLLLQTGASAAGLATVSTDSLRLRQKASTSSSILATLPQGTTADVISLSGGWFQVSVADVTGYLSADYITYAPDGTASGIITGTGVNFRKTPSAAAASLGTFSKGAAVTVLSADKGWCKVQALGQTGYVSAKYVSIEQTESPSAEVSENAAEAPCQGIVTGSTVNIRSGAGTKHSVISCATAGTIVELGELVDGWYAVTYKGVSGYMSADFVRPYAGNTASSIGSDVVELALSFLGTPYVYGGASPKGFDCSGFTLYVFGQFGYTLSHSASSQWSNSGEYVEYDDLQPGDIVLFNDPSRNAGKACSHVGIYIGDGEFVHASSGSKGKKVIISSLESGYYNTYYKGAKRIG